MQRAPCSHVKRKETHVEDRGGRRTSINDGGYGPSVIVPRKVSFHILDGCQTSVRAIALDYVCPFPLGPLFI
jgi:hypothetical protein